MMTKGLYSSTTCEWETPEELFDRLDRMYHFTLDVCATAENAKCERYFTKEDDGLQKEWSGSCWMNPPYGKEIAKWVKKAYETAKVGGYSGLSTPGSNRYCMVARLLHEG